jgi:hypothetical protein
MDACLRRMGGDISGLATWTSELGVAATALAGVARLTLVLGLRWQLRTKAVAAFPGLATLVVALAEAVALGDAGHDREDSIIAALAEARNQLAAIRAVE